MVQMVVDNGLGGRQRQKAMSGKPRAPPSDRSNISKNQQDSSIATDNSNGNVDAPDKIGGEGMGGGVNGTAARKLTKNEKRRLKNKQRRAQQAAAAPAEETPTKEEMSMVESNGVAITSWPPQEPEEEAKPSVEVSAVCLTAIYVHIGSGCLLVSLRWIL